MEKKKEACYILKCVQDNFDREYRSQFGLRGRIGSDWRVRKKGKGSGDKLTQNGSLVMYFSEEYFAQNCHVIKKISTYTEISTTHTTHQWEDIS